MYERYLGLSCQPFGIVPDPRFLFLHPRMAGDYQRLLHVARKGEGILLITGEVGTGKTLLARSALKELNGSLTVLTLDEPGPTREQILGYLCSQLGIDVEASFNVLAAHLRERLNTGQRYLLVVDEAQHISAESLEYLRLIGNIEEGTQKAVSLLLIGQPELTARLARPELRQLTQRILLHLHLTPLNQVETQDYVLYRFCTANGDKNLFQTSVFKQIYQETGGNPRLINRLMDQTLYQLAQEESRDISAALVRRSAQVLGLQHAVQAESPVATMPLRTVSKITAICVLGAGALYLAYPHFEPYAPNSNLISTAAHAEPEASTMAEPDQLDTIEVPLKNGINTETLTDDTSASVTELATETETGSHPAESLTEIQLSPEEAGKHLRALWAVDVDIPDSDVCANAVRYGLSCMRINENSLSSVLAYNRPALVRTTKGTQLLTGANKDQVLLMSGNVSEAVTLDAFTAEWDGEAQLLWRSPPGYVTPLNTGDKSFQLVFWLQNALGQLGVVEGRVITGGYYTESLADMVKGFQQEAGLVRDGILGPKTIMAINERLDSVPTL